MWKYIVVRYLLPLLTPLQNEDIAGGLSGLSMALFTRVLGWTPEELEVFLVDVRKEMKNTKVHVYFLM